MLIMTDITDQHLVCLPCMEAMDLKMKISRHSNPLLFWQKWSNTHHPEFRSVLFGCVACGDTDKFTQMIWLKGLENKDD